MKTFKQPYHLFLIAILLLLVASFFYRASTSTIDLHFADTYYVLDTSPFFLLAAGFLLVYWLFYIVVKKVLLSKLLTWLHVLATLVGTLLLVYFTYRINKVQQQPADFNLWSTYESGNKWLVILFMSLLFSQFLLLINFIGGLIQWVFKRRLKSNL